MPIRTPNEVPVKHGTPLAPGDPVRILEPGPYEDWIADVVKVDRWAERATVRVRAARREIDIKDIFDGNHLNKL